MKILVLLIALVGLTYGGNQMCWSVDQIAAAVVKHADTNNDGVMQRDELLNELILEWDLSNDSCLSFHEFTSNWNLHFHDHHDTAHAFFTNLDINHDKQLCLTDVAVRLILFDYNFDGQVQPSEFSAFMHTVHPDSHQNGGHGHGC